MFNQQPLVHLFVGSKDPHGSAAERSADLDLTLLQGSDSRRFVTYFNDGGHVLSLTFLDTLSRTENT